MAKDILNEDFKANLIIHDDGFKFLKNIRSSPAYWELKKKELMSMIRQLGAPTFFFNFVCCRKGLARIIAVPNEGSKR